MALYKVNSGDLPQASDLDQIVDTFTGNNDIGQITLAGKVSAPSSAPSGALAASSTGLSVGAYQYVCTYISGYKKSNGTLVINGETPAGPILNITTTTGNQNVNLTSIPTSTATTVIGRRIYRSKVSPSAAPTLAASGTGNTLTAGTYYVKYTWVGGGVESLTSPEASQAVTAGQQLTVTLPSFPAGVTSANIYVSTSSGTETLQRNITTTSTNFTAPISAGAAMPSTSTFYLLTQINDNVTTTYTDSTADASLTTLFPATSIKTGTSFSTVPISTTGHYLYGDSSNGLFSNSYNNNYLNANSYWDGSAWQRFNTATGSSAIVVQANGQPQFRSIGAGTGPITWNVYNLFHEGNFNQRTHVEVYLSTNQTFTTANSWYRVIFNAMNIDYLTEFDLTNGYLVVNNTGIYSINYTLRFQGVAANTTIITGTNQLNRSGNNYNVTQTVIPTNQPWHITGSQVLYLSAGTQLEIRAQVDNTNSGAAAIGGFNYATFAEFSRIA